jgi:hypothetical protein
VRRERRERETIRKYWVASRESYKEGEHKGKLPATPAVVVEAVHVVLQLAETVIMPA